MVKLARAPGGREPRWAHLLCGEVVDAVVPRVDAADDEVAALRAELLELRSQLQKLAAAVGVDL